jgi:xylulokinase
MVTVDEDGALVRDALLWNDNRSADDAVDLITELGVPQAWADQVGSVPPASFTVTKLRWLARAEPENAARTAAVLLPHDWLTWQLGGRRSDPATDCGDASGTGYFDATANAYREDLVRLALGHDLRLPTVAAPDAVVGETAAGIRLAPGTGDNMAAGLGLGLTPGTAVGAARQAAWVLTGELPDWPVPQVRTIEATAVDRAAATAIDERYSAAVREHYEAPV